MYAVPRTVLSERLLAASSLVVPSRLSPVLRFGSDRAWKIGRDDPRLAVVGAVGFARPLRLDRGCSLRRRCDHRVGSAASARPLLCRYDPHVALDLPSSSEIEVLLNNGAPTVDLEIQSCSTARTRPRGPTTPSGSPLSAEAGAMARAAGARPRAVLRAPASGSLRPPHRGCSHLAPYVPILPRPTLVRDREVAEMKYATDRL